MDIKGFSIKRVNNSCISHLQVVDSSKKESPSTNPQVYDSFIKKVRGEVGNIGLPKNFLGLDSMGTTMQGWQFGNQICDIMESYYHNSVDMDTIEQCLSHIVEDLRSSYVDMGFSAESFTKQLIQDMYDHARFANIRAAKSKSWEDSLPYAAIQNGHSQNTGDWVYYDAQHYYQAEDTNNALKAIAENLCRKYGVSEQNLSTSYAMNDIRKEMYSSYNSLFSFYARGNGIASMVDETIPPPKGFRFFYKGNDSGTDLLVPQLKAPVEEPEAAFDSSIRFWYQDQSFIGRVPVRQNAAKFPLYVNMADAVDESFSIQLPSEVREFMRNFDFFTLYQSGNYKNLHPRIF